jgi:hypothetical protein
MKYLLILLLTSCSILNHSTEPEIEKRNREKRAVIGMICIGVIVVLTVTVIDDTKNQ